MTVQRRPLSIFARTLRAPLVCASLVLVACDENSSIDTDTTAVTSADDIETTDASATDADQPLDTVQPTDTNQPLDTVDAINDVALINDGLADPVVIPAANTESPENTQLPVGDNDDTRAIAGTWDFTRETQSGSDILHATISPSGVITEYDYQGDAVGTQQDCYVIRTSGIVSRGSDQYDIQNSSALPGSEGSEDVLITVNDGEILFRYFGIDSSSEQGDMLDPRSGSFPASQEDFTNLIECEASS